MAHGKAFREAEKRIEKARRSGATKLDLSTGFGVMDTRKLSELPESLGELTWLRGLNLAGNQLQSLPQCLGQLTQLQTLNLDDNRLTSLPEWLGQLSELRTLNLSRSRLAALPEALAQLTQLESLNLEFNRTGTLPEWFGRLTRLRSLDLTENQLTSLPESLGQLRQLENLNLIFNQLTLLPDTMRHLTKLEYLALSGNAFVALPEWVLQLNNLRELYLVGNMIERIPDEICNLKRLEILMLGGEVPARRWGWRGEHGNELNELPQTLADLTELRELNLDHNPLNPELAAAYKQGLDAVKAYLRELGKGTRKRFEAKLLILGDGNEGKTCVSRALRGLPFEKQPTTRGVDVEPWSFPHPDDPREEDKEITLNIWDFEGQEINHQTHQFFLTTDSLYLLVFKCRDQFLLERAEYWLDTIRSRAPEAKVAIVVTECEERTPSVPEDRLQAEYSDLLGDGKWLYGVGCADNSGILELQSALNRFAADLKFMGRPWPDTYGEAESAIENKTKLEVPHIDREQLNAIFGEADIDEDSFDDVATSMATLGIVTQFPDCPDLSDFIVLQPQWLTKAISEIMEDKKLEEDSGEISMQRMQELWDKKGYAGLFAKFHNCMKEFELCYDLDDKGRSCLVPLRFGYIKPEIPWTEGENLKERRVIYKLNIHPPMGLMSRFIVKTHHMIVSTDDHLNGVYWHNGVFLRTGEGALRSEALCEFDSENKTLSVTVRAAFPQNMIEQVHAYVKAVFAFFAGLEPERSYGCIRIDEETKDEEQCRGVHSERRIYSAIVKERILDCEHEFHDVNPQELISGLSTFGQYVVLSRADLRNELDERPIWAASLQQDIARLVHWADDNNQLLEQVRQGQQALAPELRQELELKLRDYLGQIGEMLDDRDFTSAPGIISINTVDRSPWNPKNYFTKKLVLTPYCECENNFHPCDDGSVEFTKDRDWWEKTAPWIARGSKVLTVGLQLAFVGMPLSMSASTFDVIKDDVAFMKELTKHTELKAKGADEVDERAVDVMARLDEESWTDVRGDDREARLMRVALSRFLEEVAPVNYQARQWGSLRRVRMPDNSYRWLCGDCA